MKNKMINILFMILGVVFFLQFENCKKKDWREELDELSQQTELKLKKDHELLRSLKSDSYTILNSSSNKNSAIQRYLDGLGKYPSKDELEFAFNKKELREILYPNSLGIGTSLDKTPLNEYENLIWERKKIGETRILEKLPQGFKVGKIFWKSEVRTIGVLKGHKPESIEILHNGNKYLLSEIKQVIEHNGQFKVAVVSP